MVLVHVLLISFYFNYSASFPFEYVVNCILGGPTAAPVFMFCMGIGIVYSRRSQPEIMIKRGISLMILGLLVNIFEFILPHFVSGFLLHDSSMFGIYGGLILFYVDILGFAGLSFILFGLFKKYNLTDKQILTIAIIMSVIGSFVRYIDFNNHILNIIFGYLIGTTDTFTAFPLLNWFIFPIAGYVYGQYFIRSKDKSALFKFWSIFIFIGMIYFIITSIIPGGYLTAEDTYYFLNITAALITVVYIHGYLGFCYYISKKLPEVLINVFTTLSKNI